MRTRTSSSRTSSKVIFASGSATTATRSWTCRPARCSASRATFRTRRRRWRTRSTWTCSTRPAPTGSTEATRIFALRRRPEGEQLGAVLVQPSPLLPPLRPAALDEPPEAAGVIRLSQMAHLVDDDVVEHLEGREHEPPVEREVARGRARPPARPLVANVDAVHLDAERLRLLLDEHVCELTRGAPALELG